MSEINDLIHTNARVAFDQGVKTERERIIKLLQVKRRDLERLAVYNRAIGDLHSLAANRTAITQLDHYLALIKGTQK